MNILKSLKIRFLLLITILPIGIIPLLILSAISMRILFSYLENKNKEFYETVLTQVASNFDFIYKQYAMNFYDITLLPNFIKLINYPTYKSQTEERMLVRNIDGLGSNPFGNSIRRAVMVKFEGIFLIGELDRISLLDPEHGFKKHYFTFDTIQVDNNKFLNDPLFKELKNNPNIKLNFGKMEDGVLIGYDVENSMVFIYPYYPQDAKEFTKFMMVIVKESFISNIYKDIQPLFYGTLYVLDKNNKILSKNHPSKDDYFKFDEQKKRYISEENEYYDDFNNMSIIDYNNLNTDEKILNDKNVMDLLKRYENNEDIGTKIIKYKGKSYLFLIYLSSESQVKFLYFHPLNHIYKPVYYVISVIFFTVIAMLILIIIICIILSALFSTPIKKLAIGAAEISKRNYSYQIDTKRFFGEFIILGKSFNEMTTTIDSYNKHLEQLVEQRTIELKKANEELSYVNEKLIKINEQNLKELKMAQKIQEALIPKVFPESKAINLYGIYLPMESLGGDLYDVYKISENKYGVVILDVCGHGVPAALITTMAKVAFSNYSKKENSVETIVSLVNNDIHELVGNIGNYLTSFYCIIDTNNYTIQYINAGHNEMYLLKKDRTIVPLTSNSTIIGAVPNIQFRSDTITYENGDKLILYTDGIPEARNDNKEFFGEERFKKIIVENYYKNVADMVKIIINSLKEFKGDIKNNDDIALLIAEFIIHPDKKVELDIGYIER